MESGESKAGTMGWSNDVRPVCYEMYQLMSRLVAQLYPAARVARDRPAEGPTEGPTPDLGPQGMYASLAFEDIAALLPWVEFKGGGAHHAEAMRSGLGFE